MWVFSALLAVWLTSLHRDPQHSSGIWMSLVPVFFLGLSMLRAYKQTKRTIGKWQTDYSRNVTHPRMSHRDGVLPMATDNACPETHLHSNESPCFCFFSPHPQKHNKRADPTRQRWKNRNVRHLIYDACFLCSGTQCVDFRLTCS